MDVTCRKCGAAVPADHAFCTECGAVMSEAADATAEDAPELSSTMAGHFSKPTFVPPPEAGGREAARAVAVTTPERVGGRRSAALFAAGVVAVLLLGGLLFYLVGLILAR